MNKKEIPTLAAAAFKRFLEVIAKLRDPDGGCPWDLKQTHDSIRPYLLEEAYELLEAIEAGDDKELTTELGDVLLQVALHAQIAADRDAFSITEVVTTVTEKMIRRHPHVFGETQVKDAEEVLKNWEQIKQDEKQKQESSVLDGVPKAMPALIRASRIGHKASKWNFDWDNAEGVLAKLKEELKELEEELQSGDHQRMEAELGDLLFAASQLARRLELSPEDALHRATERFSSRFRQMERIQPGPWDELEEAELEALWQRAKAELKNG